MFEHYMREMLAADCLDRVDWLYSRQGGVETSYKQGLLADEELAALDAAYGHMYDEMFKM